MSSRFKLITTGGEYMVSYGQDKTGVNYQVTSCQSGNIVLDKPINPHLGSIVGPRVLKDITERDWKYGVVQAIIVPDEFLAFFLRDDWLSSQPIRVYPRGDFDD